MSGKISALVRSAELANSTHKAVALVLASYAEDDGSSVFPSVARIAREACLSESSVHRATRALMASGILNLVKRGGGYHSATNCYAFSISALRSVNARGNVARVSPRHPLMGVSQNASRVSHGHLRGVTVTPNSLVTGQEEEVKEASKEKKYIKQYPSLVAARKVKGIGKKTSFIGSEGPEAHDEPGVPAKPETVKLAASEAGQVRRFLPKATPAPSPVIDRALLRRAEGLGLPLDELLAATDRAKPNDPDGYFQGLCRRRLRRILPNASDALLGRALSHDDRAYGTLTSLLVMAGAAS